MLLAPAHARPDASRIVDRTFSCESGYVGGVYQAELNSTWFVPQNGARIPSATVSTSLGQSSIAGVSSTSVVVNRVHCTGTRAAVRLTTKGLSGGPFGTLDRSYDCYTPRRVLVRVRGEFVKPTPFATASPFGYPQLQALGATKRTELAIATPVGRSIAYASIAGPGKARLYTSTNCRED
ncbi:MAG TPA: hypothetical protein VFU99_11460 [Gaiellaceae bacterium]|nr:hypothetical protein [Gaiellaceae bacterium]